MSSCRVARSAIWLISGASPSGLSLKSMNSRWAISARFRADCGVRVMLQSRRLSDLKSLIRKIAPGRSPSLKSLITRVLSLGKHSRNPVTPVVRPLSLLR
ncbi:hypothetical protein D3C78_1458120 [compost metagenome]